MNNIKYLKYLIKHKFYVTRECFKHGLYWRGLVHDLSKFMPCEWIPYKNYFYGTYLPYVPICPTFGVQTKIWEKSKEGVELEFNFAWLHHQKLNKHHWQYWILIEDSGKIIPMEMPIIYIMEMVCDWIGAGMAITGKREVDEWYEKNKDKMMMTDRTRKLTECFLITMI